jgi:hypothetical protein
MSLMLEQFEFLKDVAKLIEFVTVKGFIITAGELYRPQMMQEHYYKTGKSKTLTSNHTKRLAIDLNFFKYNKLTYSYDAIKEIGDFWESLNEKNRWGGDWNGNDIRDEKFIDTPHFERSL